MDSGSAHIRGQLQALSQPSDSEPLAVVQALARIMRLNVTFKDGTKKSQNIAMPVFVPDDGVLPSIVPPEAEKPTARTRKRRNDNALDDQAFLPSLRVYRYRT